MLAQLIRKASGPKRNRQGRRTAIFSDVDGVILPEFHGGTPAHPESWGTVEIEWQNTSYYRRSVIDFLRKHPADHKVWLSSWQEGAKAVFDDKVGSWDILSPDDQKHEWWHPGPTDWWKANLLLEWIQKNPGVTHVVWCEDELEDEDRIEAARTVYNILRSKGIRVMSVCTQSEVGLTDAQMDLIGTFAKGGI